MQHDPAKSAGWAKAGSGERLEARQAKGQRRRGKAHPSPIAEPAKAYLPQPRRWASALARCTGLRGLWALSKAPGREEALILATYPRADRAARCSVMARAKSVVASCACAAVSRGWASRQFEVFARKVANLRRCCVDTLLCVECST
jgi:hypothetical protein